MAFGFISAKSQQLLYSRFVNVHRLSGRNIAADLHVEHLDRACKDAIKGLGANKTITGIGKAIGPLMTITSNYDADVHSTVAGSSMRLVVSAERQKNDHD